MPFVFAAASVSAVPMNFSRPARVIETSAISRSLASFGSFDARMILITRSRLARASARPRSRWARSSAFFRSNCVRRMTTVLRWSMKWRSRSCSGRTRGWFSTIARKMIPKVDCIGVSA